MSVRQQLGADYGVFVNAFSYTVATNVLQSNFDNGHHSMLIVAVMLVVLLVALAMVRVEIVVDRDSIAAGPVAMFKYVLDTGSTVLVHFLSVAVGQWVSEVQTANVSTDTPGAVPAVVLGTAMLWLVGTSAGFVTAD